MLEHVKLLDLEITDLITYGKVRIIELYGSQMLALAPQGVSYTHRFTSQLRNSNFMGP